MTSEDIKKLVESLKNEDLYTFEQRCKEFFYNHSYEFASIDQNNRDLIINFLKNFKSNNNFGTIMCFVKAAIQ